MSGNTNTKTHTHTNTHWDGLQWKSLSGVATSNPSICRKISSISGKNLARFSSNSLAHLFICFVAHHQSVLVFSQVNRCARDFIVDSRTYNNNNAYIVNYCPHIRIISTYYVQINFKYLQYIQKMRIRASFWLEILCVVSDLCNGFACVAHAHLRQ